MLTECANCGKRHEVPRSNEGLELACACGEKLPVLPWLSYRQTVSISRHMQCCLCKRQYDPVDYRDGTEIACDCGNLLIVRRTETGGPPRGRRKTDQMSQFLQRKLQGLADTCRLLHSIRDLDKLLMLIVRVTSDMLDAEGSTVVLRDAESSDLVFHSVVGERSDELAHFRLTEGGLLVTKGNMAKKGRQPMSPG